MAITQGSALQISWERSPRRSGGSAPLPRTFPSCAF